LRTYEGMFLFDPTFATDMGKVEQEIARLMERAGAEIIMCNKWDERKLAYEIKGRKRGCYVLVFFRAESDKITGIERDVQLSESVLRVLIMRADYMTEEDMKAAYVIRSQPAGHGRGDREDRRFGGGQEERRRPRDEREGPPRRPEAEKPGPATTATAEPDRDADEES
jgi:small subunit ribosomal protein S6